MTIAFRNSVAAFGSTSVSVTVPTGTATGDAVLIHVSVKPDTATINTPSGWTLIADVAGGGGTAGSQVGPSRQAVFFREKDAGWSTIPAITATGSNIVGVGVSSFSKSASTAWGIAAATGTWGSAATTTNATTTLGSNPGITAADAAVVNYTNMASAPTWSAQSVSATGISAWGAVSNATRQGSGSFGNAISFEFFWVPVTTGTATAAPVTNATVSAAGRGTVSLVRLREVAAAPGQGTATGTFTFTGTATGTRAPKATGSGTFTFTGTATGTRTPKASASGSFAFTGTAVGSRPAKGTAGGSYTYNGTATGTRTPKATAGGTYAYTGSATGTAPVVGAAEGTASGTYAYTGTAVGSAPAVGIAQGTATGTWTYTGTALGVAPGVVEPPTPQRRIVSAVLTIPTLAADLEVPGSIAATLTAAGTLRADLTIPEARGVLT